MSEWLEVGADTYVLVTEGSLLNTGLVVGSERAMVIDASCGPRQAQRSIRESPSDATKAIPVLPYGPEQSRWFIKHLQETRPLH